MLFKILKGNSSRISTSITPFHEGWAYFTSDDGKFYIDTVVNGENKRVCITEKTIVSAEEPENLSETDIWLKEVK